jgi:hypothetical protein
MEVFKTYKQRGEWIELLFMTLAVKRGYVVLKPWGDSARYDVGIELGGRFMRIQVKGTDYRRWGGYTCILSGGKRQAYTTKQIDYFAIYVLEEDIWYIFPAKRLAGQSSVMLSPRRAKNPHRVTRRLGTCSIRGSTWRFEGWMVRLVKPLANAEGLVVAGRRVVRRIRHRAAARYTRAARTAESGCPHMDGVRRIADSCGLNLPVRNDTNR